MFGKKKKDSEKKKSTIDKLIMGAIVGGAIGSVVGMSIAPQKGKETRDLLAKKGKDFYEKGKEIGNKVQEEVKDRTEKSKGIFSRLKEKILGSKKKKSAKLAEENELKKIPNEFE